ncbi:hypothetical protein [Streptomyces sp. DH8]|uniref:hypothetical protein n=1 Tax=Streptomyces sp. DH8 TaxID=2857008 RepID=UPI001E507444|nr:hypothetical protein [Streptomyces sp. DH8]
MSEARSEMTQQHPRGTGQGAVSGGSGKHRGGASLETSPVRPHGRHRRPAEDEARAA